MTRPITPLEYMAMVARYQELVAGHRWKEARKYYRKLQSSVHAALAEGK